MDNTAKLDQTMRKISSGKQISSPSDNPPDMARLFRFHNQSEQIDQNQKNISSARNFLSNSEGILSNVTNIFQRVRELGIRAANDSLSSSERDLIAAEIDERLEELVDIANSKMGGRFLFGGAETEGLDEIFSVERSGKGEIIGVTYNGDANNLVNQVGEGENVVSNIAGHEVFQASNQKLTGGVTFADPAVTLDNITGSKTEGYFQLGGEKYYYDTSKDTVEDLVDRVNEKGAPIKAEIVDAVDPATGNPIPGQSKLAFETRTPKQIYLRDFDRNPDDKTTVDGLLKDLEFVDGSDTDTDNFPPSLHQNATVYGKSVFDAMIDFRHALQAGEQSYDSTVTMQYGNANVDPTRQLAYIENNIAESIQQGLEDMQKSIDNNLVHRSIGGARTNRVDSAEVRAQDQKLNTTELISQLEDADLAEVITEHKMREAVQQASLRMASQVMKLSLANFI
jgi:flagellar hook-associated protein 3 FlgL